MILSAAAGAFPRKVLWRFQGGILEGFGRLLKYDLKIYVCEFFAASDPHRQAFLPICSQSQQICHQQETNRSKMTRPGMRGSMLQIPLLLTGIL